MKKKDPIESIRTWRKFRTGIDVVKLNGQLTNVVVYEFPTETDLRSFLEHIGGAPHPLGGLRAVLAT